jgi:hypothetical protein
MPLADGAGRNHTAFRIYSNEKISKLCGCCFSRAQEKHFGMISLLSGTFIASNK